MEELETTGVIWTLQEFAEDVNGVGAVINGPDGALVGAINVYGPTYRFPGTRPRDEIAEAITGACQRITTRLTS